MQVGRQPTVRSSGCNFGSAVWGRQLGGGSWGGTGAIGAAIGVAVGVAVGGGSWGGS